MVRNVVANESLLTYLHNSSKDNVFSIGLIIGQHYNDKDYLVHLAKTPRIKSDESESQIHNELKSLNDVKDNWLAEHARQATKMLPGGMYVLGIFIISPEELSFAQPKLKSILSAIQKELHSSQYLFGNADLDKLILNYVSMSNQYSCKSYERSLGMIKPVDIKFLSQNTPWVELECKFQIDQKYSIGNGDYVGHLKHHMNLLLDKIKDNLQDAHFLFDGKLKSTEDTIDNISKKKLKTNRSQMRVEEEAKPIKICILQKCVGDSFFEVANEHNEIKFCGHIFSKLWLHPTFSIKDATKALTEDILRSFNTRLEMHWDSLTEEEHGEEVNSLHEPPRRVLIPLPYSSVAISDYLFPGEGPQDAKNSLEEVLDFKIENISDVIEVEEQADLAEYCNETMDETEEPATKQESTKNNKFLLFIGLEIALLTLVLAIVIHYYSR